MVKPKASLGEDFESPENVDKTSRVLDCELWEETLKPLLVVMKKYMSNSWAKEYKLYEYPL